MIDLLVKDLDKETTEAETTEKEAQKEYVQYTMESAKKRASDAQSVTDKESAQADTEAELVSHSEKKDADVKKLMATVEYIHSLHAECDWLLQYFDVRKEARSSEIDALGKAKAVLSGADFSLVQT